MNAPSSRSRIVYALLMIAVIALGLASRSRFAQTNLPRFIAEYAGDTLWALLVFLLFGFLWPRWSTWRVALLTAMFSLLIELSQLYHVPWLDAIRRTRLGGLVLGYGFLWSDLLCYFTGIVIGVGLESAWKKNRPGSS